MTNTAYCPEHTYRIPRWSDGYFKADAQGNLIYAATETPLNTLVDQLEAEGLDLPVLIRFNDILKDRLHKLGQAFEHSITHNELDSSYTPVYPIKVNQQFSVIKALLDAKRPMGLEAGSKAELLAIIGIAPKQHPIICNGYKDRNYLRLALIAQAMGHPVYIVIEQPVELDYLLEVSEELGVEPVIGMRIRLATIGKGRWQNSGGERSKFGLSAAELYEAVQRLKQGQQLHWLKLLHVHMGSQISELSFIQQGVREATQFYIDLCRMGAQLETLDVGGGLGVDYEGLGSRHEYSISYTLEEYADTIVRTVHMATQKAGLAMPQLMSESGRALTAHHAVLVVPVGDVESLLTPRPEVTPLDGQAEPLSNLKHLKQQTLESPSESCFEQAQSHIFHAYQDYAQGRLSLEGRIQAEMLYYDICQHLDRHNEALPDDLREALHTKLASKYFCNLSIFQSLPDVWGIEQIFPIVPTSRLNEEPDEYAVIHDLTCDSDGQIDRYACESEYAHTLRVHTLHPGERYLLGIFMVGAYQEILGDMHNLFGDTHAVNVEQTAEGTLEIVNLEEGDKASELLNYVHFDLDKLVDSYRQKLEGVDKADYYLQRLLHNLNNYTYLTNR